MIEDPALPLVFSRQDAVRMGLTSDAVTWRVRTGRWHTLRRGAFCSAAVYEEATPEERHLLTALAALTTPGARVERLSHLSAALAYGWPGPPTIPELPWFTAQGKGSLPTRRRSGVVRQIAPLPHRHCWTSNSIPITSPARTVADCLRHLRPEDSVPIADAAVRDGTDIDEIHRVLSWQAQWPYVARGLASVRLVDGRRESWLESVSAVAVHRLRLPAPAAQVTVRDERGAFVARVDFGWDGVVGECDGWAKYRVPAAGTGAPGQNRDSQALIDPDVFRREKVREDRLRDLGDVVVRWTTADVLDPERLRRKLERALKRAEPGRLLGSRTLEPQLARPAGPSAVGLSRLAARSSDGRLIASYSTSARDLAS